MSHENRTFLVLGMGELGNAVINGLCDYTPGQMSNITVLMRPQSLESPSPDKQIQIEQLRSVGIEFISSDLAADSTLKLSTVFAPFHTVIGCTGFASGTSIQRKICQAVVDAGVARYVPWQFGVDYDVIGRGSAQELFDEQLDVRDLLRGQTKTDWVIISTGMFISFLFEPSLGVVDLKSNIIHALGALNNEITVTSVDDIGKLTATILHTEPTIRNEIVYTAGDTVTYSQLAQILERVCARKLRRDVWSVSKLENDLARTPQDVMDKYRAVFAQGRGVSWSKKHSFNARRGIATTSIEQWATDHFKNHISQSGK